MTEIEMMRIIVDLQVGEMLDAIRESVQVYPGDYAVIRRDLGDGFMLEITPMTYGKYRLNHGPVGAPFYDDSW